MHMLLLLLDCDSCMFRWFLSTSLQIIYVYALVMANRNKVLFVYIDWSSGLKVIFWLFLYSKLSHEVISIKIFFYPWVAVWIHVALVICRFDRELFCVCRVWKWSGHCLTWAWFVAMGYDWNVTLQFLEDLACCVLVRPHISAEEIAFALWRELSKRWTC